MAITYYANEKRTRTTHVIHKLQKPRMLHSSFGVAECAPNAVIDIWCPVSWKIERVSVKFTSSDGETFAGNKDYSIGVVRGIGVVKDYKDRLWIKPDKFNAQSLYIPQGFYDEASIVNAISQQFDENEFLEDLNQVVAYDDQTGLFSIQVDGTRKIKLFNQYLSSLVKPHSTFAHLIGFNEDSEYSHEIESDTPVLGLGTEFKYVAEEASSSSVVISTDNLAMTIDNCLRISVENTTADQVRYEIVYNSLDA